MQPIPSHRQPGIGTTTCTFRSLTPPMTVKTPTRILGAFVKGRLYIEPPNFAGARTSGNSLDSQVGFAGLDAKMCSLEHL